MEALGKHLLQAVPARTLANSKPVWEKISGDLGSGIHLETTFLRNPPGSDLELLIVDLTARLILDAEKGIIEDAITKIHSKEPNLYRR